MLNLHQKNRAMAEHRIVILATQRRSSQYLSLWRRRLASKCAKRKEGQRQQMLLLRRFILRKYFQKWTQLMSSLEGNLKVHTFYPVVIANSTMFQTEIEGKATDLYAVGAVRTLFARWRRMAITQRAQQQALSDGVITEVKTAHSSTRNAYNATTSTKRTQYDPDALVRLQKLALSFRRKKRLSRVWKRWKKSAKLKTFESRRKLVMMNLKLLSDIPSSYSFCLGINRYSHRHTQIRFSSVKLSWVGRTYP